MLDGEDEDEESLIGDVVGVNGVLADGVLVIAGATVVNGCVVLVTGCEELATGDVVTVALPDVGTEAVALAGCEGETEEAFVVGIVAVVGVALTVG